MLFLQNAEHAVVIKLPSHDASPPTKIGRIGCPFQEREFISRKAYENSIFKKWCRKNFVPFSKEAGKCSDSKPYKAHAQRINYHDFESSHRNGFGDCCKTSYSSIKLDRDKSGIEESSWSDWIKEIVNVPFLFAIEFYRKVFSPLKPSSCIYTPTCSKYSYQAIKKYGPIKGGWLAVKRIVRCRPGMPGGYDPIP